MNISGVLLSPLTQNIQTNPQIKKQEAPTPPPPPTIPSTGTDADGDNDRTGSKINVYA